MESVFSSNEMIDDEVINVYLSNVEYSQEEIVNDLVMMMMMMNESMIEMETEMELKQLVFDMVQE